MMIIMIMVMIMMNTAISDSPKHIPCRYYSPLTNTHRKSDVRFLEMDYVLSFVSSESRVAVERVDVMI